MQVVTFGQIFSLVRYKNRQVWLVELTVGFKTNAVDASIRLKAELTIELFLYECRLVLTKSFNLASGYLRTLLHNDNCM